MSNISTEKQWSRCVFNEILAVSLRFLDTIPIKARGCQQLDQSNFEKKAGECGKTYKNEVV